MSSATAPAPSGRPAPAAVRRLAAPPLGHDEQRRYREAWSHWKEDRPSLALARMRELVRLYPERAQHHYNLASMLSGAGDLDGAVTAFRAAVRLQPDYYQGLAGLGIALARKAGIREDEPGGHVPATLLFSEAAAHLQRALRGVPEGESPYHPGIYLGFALGRLRRYPEASEAYRQALTANPRDADGWASLGRMLWAQKRFAEAADAYERALALHAAREAGGAAGVSLLPLRGGPAGPAPAALYEEAARLYLALEAPAAAVVKCRRALALDPDWAAAYQTLGRALEKLGDIIAARECFARFERLPGGAIEKGDYDTVEALEAREKVRRSYVAFNAAWREGRLPDAAAALSEAIGAQPENAVHRFNLALVRRRQDRTADAVTCLREALRLDPDHAGARGVLGAILAWRAFTWEARARDAATARERYEEALSLLDGALEGAPSLAGEEDGPEQRASYQVHMYRGLCLGRLRRLDEAMCAFDRAVELAPRSHWPRLLRADVLWHAGRTLEAEDALRSLLHAGGEAELSAETRADVLERLGRLLLFGRRRPKQAAAACREAIAAAPEKARPHETLAEALSRLGDAEGAADAEITAAALRFRKRRLKTFPGNGEG